ncbi:MAG: hypothetical protein SFU53_09575 [Terrimicrobiaceae bacterium]|nr:hypothetical protein [Terrimicrobiaceae bacterium]
MNPWLGMALVLGALGLLMGTFRLLQGRLSPELSRKGVHVGMGLVCLTFPWLFQESWPVVILALLAVLSLAAVRFLPFLRQHLGGVLGGVERKSLGEFYFPMAVAAVFVFSLGNPLFFVIPVLTLTVADSVGALIGLRYGFARYQTDEGLKSAEGSVAFFTAAFLSCHIPLLLFSNTGRAETLLISLTAGFVVMLLEAIAWRGQDNLIIPLAMFVLLMFYSGLGVADLLWRFGVIVALVIFVLVWRKKTTLSDSAVLAGALSGYAVGALGGWMWLLPPLLLFVIYIGLPKFPAENRPVQNLHAVTRVMAGGFVWLIAAEMTGRKEFWIPYFLCMAAHTGNIISARLRVVRPEFSKTKVVLTAVLASVLGFGILGLAAVFGGMIPPGVFLLLPLAVLLSVLIFFPSWPASDADSHRVRIWLSETGIAFVASTLGLLMIPAP